MSTSIDLLSQALFRASVVLAREPDGHGTALQDLWRRVTAEDPLLEQDGAQGAAKAGDGLLKRFRFESIHLVKAGWLCKQNRKWRLTGLGRRALGEFPDPQVYLAEARERYGYWNRNRAAFDTVAGLLEVLPDGRWAASADLAAASALDEAALLAWLQGMRPSGWHLVLGPDGELPDGLGLSPRERDEWRHLLEGEGLYDERASSADVIRVRPGTGLSAAQLAELLQESAEQQTADAGPAARPRRAGLVRGRDARGAGLIRGRWAEQGVCSLAADRLPYLAAGDGAERVRAVVDEAYSGTSASDRELKAEEFHTFLSRMREGDVVVAVDGADTFLGTVTGPAVQRRGEDGRAALQRPVTWHNLDSPLDFYEDLPPGMIGPLGNPDLGLVDLTEFVEDLEHRIEAGAGARGGTGAPDSGPAQAAAPAELPDATSALADKVSMRDTAWLQECVELLRDRPQLIFHGPPGTGKTYTALALAQHLTGGNPGNTALVQFHPAYSYEDFFEGFRPRAADSGAAGSTAGPVPGGIVFDLVEGPLKRLANAARKRPSEVFVLVIDEINRGHLAKVFGELYFLLEYRDQFVHLLYHADETHRFQLPPNLVLLGTMNTADRSIALMDAAMRRRFSFMELHPDRDPTAEMLSRWLTARQYPGHTAALLDELNRRIAANPAADGDFRIGPSYLMRPAVHRSPQALQRVWRTQILPALTEYHWGDHTDVGGQYGLDVLCAALSLDLEQQYGAPAGAGAGGAAGGSGDGGAADRAG